MNESSVLSKKRIKCSEIMSEKVTSASADASLRAIAQMLKAGDIGILPIVDDGGKLLGLVTDRDIVVRAVAEGSDVKTTTVGDIMTTELYTAGPDDFAFEAVRTMGDRKVRRVPIVDDDGVLVGIVSIADIALEMEDEKEVAETLEEISSGKGFWNKR
ncbi:MAG: CBS domain-containing protein [Pyrinomonadaceae bacterium]|nr:CBS domain-containing protein [Pyrinomonadaceae bacterium]